MSISFNTLRVGKQYVIKNFGEKSYFEVLEVYDDEDFRVKDLLTLEEFYLKAIIAYGKGDDFQLEEL